LNLEGDIDATAMRDTGIYATRQLAKHRDARCRIQDAGFKMQGKPDERRSPHLEPA